MVLSYKKLWKILINRDMKKKDLCAAAGISHTSMLQPNFMDTLSLGKNNAYEPILS